ncbi:MAG: translation initiation factor IF-3 [Chloroflexi bacterium]|nr:translation initiation factor IF-3 [Chloroflexota bacterium]
MSTKDSGKDLRVNERIRVREVRVIDENGEQLGVLPTFEALELARNRNVDLVEVAPMAVPPVCRLLDYGRFKYEQEKKEREARKNQKNIELKEIRLRPKIGEHDFHAKEVRARDFIEEGDKVKVTVLFRGRELAHPQLGRELLEKMAQRLSDVAVVERAPMTEGKTMHVILSRGKAAQAAPAQGAASAQAQLRPARPARTPVTTA